MALDPAVLNELLLKRFPNQAPTGSAAVMYVVMFSQENVLLTLDEFNLAVSNEIEKTHDFAFLRSMQRIYKLKQVKDIAAYLDKINSSFEVLNQKVDETKLLAINSLISSSLCGLPGESFSDVVQQVNLLCNQSKDFLIDIKKGIETTCLAVDSIMKLVNSTIESEINVMSSLKMRIDFNLGKFVTHQYYLSMQKTSDFELFRSVVEQDFQELLTSILEIQEYVVMLLSKQQQDVQLSLEIMQSLQRLKDISNASLFWK